MAVTCDIFIKTCAHDADYHRHCMASIDKFCTGFRNVVVIDTEAPTPAKGYLQQQVIKMHADTYSDADFFLVTDSDTLFTRPVIPETFMREGKPIWLHTPWTEEMLAHPGTRAWFDVMTEFHGVQPPSEFMRRQPFFFPRWLTASLRTFCGVQHNRTLENYVTKKGRFSEWNVLGHHAWRNFQDRFHWIDTSKDELPELVVKQYWSHDPIENNIEEINRILA